MIRECVKCGSEVGSAMKEGLAREDGERGCGCDKGGCDKKRYGRRMQVMEGME